MNNILIGIVLFMLIVIVDIYLSTKYDIARKRVIFMVLVSPVVAGFLSILLSFINIIFTEIEFEVGMFLIFPFITFFSLLLMFPILITFSVVIFSIEKAVSPNLLKLLLWTIVVSFVLSIPYALAIDDYGILLITPIVMSISMMLERYYLQSKHKKEM